MILITHHGEITHIMAYEVPNGYIALCDANVPKEYTNTLACDNSFDGICKSCKLAYDSSAKWALDGLGGRAYSSSINYNGVLLAYHKGDILGPEPRYEGLLRRKWPKITNLQRLISRKGKRAKRSK